MRKRNVIWPYLQHYEQQRTQLLARRGTPNHDHPHSGATIFGLLWQCLQQEHLAADVLRVGTLLHAEVLPEEVFVEGTTSLGPSFAALAADSTAPDQALAVLRSFSPAQRYPKARTFSLHRLVQVVQCELMSKPEQESWLKRASTALCAVLRLGAM